MSRTGKFNKNVFLVSILVLSSTTFAQGILNQPSVPITVANGILISCASSVPVWNTWLASSTTIFTFSICLELDSIVPAGGSTPFVVEGSCNSAATSLANQSFDFTGAGRWNHGQGGSVTIIGSGCAYSTGNYSLRIVVGLPDLSGTVIQAFIPVTVGAPPPTISSVTNGASFLSGITSGSWVTIKGTNLSLGPITDTWDNAIVNGKLPTTLDGVSVSIGFKAAYVNFISPTQINVQAPDVSSGPVPITVTTPFGSATINGTSTVQAAPAFFLWAGKYSVATRQDYSLAAKNGTFAGSTVPAKPGEVIILWGTAFGPTSPALSAGTQAPVGQLYSTATPVSVTINNIPTQVYGAALAPGFVGLYQIGIQIPSSLTDGDWPIQAQVDGAQSPSNVFITVQH
jgi:uncharacterized protein (TIGR03437 family)